MVFGVMVGKGERAGVEASHNVQQWVGLGGYSGLQAPYADQDLSYSSWLWSVSPLEFVFAVIEAGHARPERCWRGDSGRERATGGRRATTC